MNVLPSGNTLDVNIYTLPVVNCQLHKLHKQHSNTYTLNIIRRVTLERVRREQRAPGGQMSAEWAHLKATRTPNPGAGERPGMSVGDPTGRCGHWLTAKVTGRSGDLDRSPDQLRQVTGPRQTPAAVSCSPLRAPRQPVGRVVTRLQSGRRSVRPPDRLLTATSNPAGRRCNKTTSSELTGADTVATIDSTNTVHTVTHKRLTNMPHTHRILSWFASEYNSLYL